MKTESTQIRKSIVFTFSVLILCVTGNAFGQNNNNNGNNGNGNNQNNNNNGNGNNNNTGNCLWDDNGPDTVKTHKHVVATKSMTVTGTLTVKGILSADTMKITRIQPADGDSIIALGRHSVYLNTNTNNIYWNSVNAQNGGFSIGNGYAGSPSNAHGFNSMALGWNSSTTTTGTYSMSVGTDASTTADHSAAFGTQASAAGVFSTALGFAASTSTAGDHSTALGTYARAHGSFSTALGINATATGGYSVAIGSQAQTLGSNSLAIGNNAIANGAYSMALGNNITIGAAATNAFVLGSGANSSSFLVNNIANSLIIGFNSTAPTLFVGNIGTVGRVGIGTTAPASKLEVDGSSNATIRIVDGNQAAGKVLTSDATGQGSWQTPAAAANDWTRNGNLNALSTDKLGATFPGVNLNIYAGGHLCQFIDGTTGNVGVGTNAPSADLEIKKALVPPYTAQFKITSDPTEGTGSVWFKENPNGDLQILPFSTNTGINSQSGRFVGIGTYFTGGPHNTLEITSDGFSYPASPNGGGKSGLRFTNMTNSLGAHYSITANVDANGGVLSVNQFGDVILVSGGGGATGATGSTGINGVTGATGVIGATGTTGNNGFTGSTGATGITGSNGFTGSTGATGNNGATGATGTNGTNGFIGSTGTTGNAGNNGITGATGADGSLNAWALLGNAGTVDGTNFIGTTDNVPFNIRVNNTPAGRIDPILYNNFFGYEAGKYQSVNLNATGQYNTATGFQALYSNTTGFGNTANGYQALYNNLGGGCFYCPGSINTATGIYALYSNTTGPYNTANGSYALYSNTTGADNIASGYQALYSNTSGAYNIANGVGALYSNITGNSNTANGEYALYSNATGGNNTATGADALYYNTSGTYNTATGGGALQTNTTGTYNTATGNVALQTNTTGNFNTASGSSALYYNTSGTYNTAFGSYALNSNTTGNFNTALGYRADVGSAGATNATALGGFAVATANNSTALGYGALVNSGASYSNALGYGAYVSPNATNATAIGNGAAANLPDVMFLGNSTTVVTYVNPPNQGSDGRFKTNVTENVKGLAFINKLRPVTFNINTNALDDLLIQNMSDSLKAVHKAGLNFAASTAIVHSGFIAQEVEQAAQDVGFTSSIVHTPANSADPYGLAYGEFVVPLVKAVQELDSTLTIVSASGIKAKGTPVVNKLTKFTATDSISNSQIYDDGTNVGINTVTPNNKLEVNSGIANTSGLTFTNLNLASAASPANGKALSVSPTGEVILTDGTVGATGVTGSSGSTGATGTNGIDGNTGATGSSGNTGANGIDGSTGATGAAGANGSTGATGNTGAMGVTGATGSGISLANTRIAYGGLNGVTSDSLFTRDSATSQTFISKRYSSSVKSGYQLDGLLGVLNGSANILSNSSTGDNAVNGVVDLTPFGGTNVTAVVGYVNFSKRDNSILTADSTGLKIQGQNINSIELNRQHIQFLVNNGNYTFPDSSGSNGQVMVNDGAGNMRWRALSSSGWSLTGNAGTVDGTNFIGTTDNVPFTVKVNNQQAGRIDPTLANTYWGYQAGLNFNQLGLTPGAGGRNIGIGFQALAGSGAPMANTAQDNVAIGFQAMANTTTGGQNTAIGLVALYNNTSGSNNQAIGSRALQANNTGTDNVAISGTSLPQNTSGSGNIAIGNHTMYNNKTGNYNTSAGYNALAGSGTSTNNSNNTAFGFYAGNYGNDGNYNTYIGSNADGSNLIATLNNATAIGAYTIVMQSNSVILGNNANVGIGTSAPAYKLEVVGDANFNGVVHTTSGNVVVSDQHFKTNITALPSVKSIIDSLKPKTFYFDTANVNGINFPKELQYGFVAQDVEHVLPALVTSATKHADVDTSGTVIHPAVTYKALNYNAFIGILTKGLQEQQQKIDSLAQGLNAEKTKTNSQDSINTYLKNEINQLMAAINNCCKNNHNNRAMQSDSIGSQDKSVAKQTDVQLSNKNIVVLDQNVPNPFAEETTINYNLPDDFTRAQIIFMDQSGKLIKAVELTEKGRGTLNVFAQDLSNGIYTYSLIVDGQTMETKKMMKAK